MSHENSGVTPLTHRKTDWNAALVWNYKQYDSQWAISIKISPNFYRAEILIEIWAFVVFVLSQLFVHSIRNDWYFAFWVNIDWAQKCIRTYSVLIRGQLWNWNFQNLINIVYNRGNWPFWIQIWLFLGRLTTSLLFLLETWPNSQNLVGQIRPWHTECFTKGYSNNVWLNKVFPITFHYQCPAKAALKCPRPTSHNRSIKSHW